MRSWVGGHLVFIHLPNVHRISLKPASLIKGVSTNPPYTEPSAWIISIPHPEGKRRREWKLKEGVAFSFKQEQNLQVQEPQDQQVYTGVRSVGVQKCLQRPQTLVSYPSVRPQALSSLH